MKNTSKSKARVCVQCSCKIQGRSDKVFCGISCKNEYHKIQKKERSNNTEPFFQILNKNYIILEGISEGKNEPFEIKKSQLANLGYVFGYYTNILSNYSSSCFNYSIHLINENTLKIIPPEFRNKHNSIFYNRWNYKLRNHSINRIA